MQNNISETPAPQFEGRIPTVVTQKRGLPFAAPIAVATLVWAVTLVYLATIPRTPHIPFVSSEMSSAIGHALTHAVLAALIYLLVAGTDATFRRRVLALRLALAGSLVLGIGLEFVQLEYTSTRQFEWGDVGDNIAGSLTGSLTVFAAHSFGLGGKALRKLFVAGSLALIGLVTASLVIFDPNLPYVGDHWHARYSISVCGVPEPPLADAPGGVHSHGDGLIHIHPMNTFEEGRNATLNLFFRTHHATFTGDSVGLPSGRLVANGDTCPSGALGEWVVLVNGRAIARPESYVMRDGDDIQILFR